MSTTASVATTRGGVRRSKATLTEGAKVLATTNFGPSHLLAWGFQTVFAGFLGMVMYMSPIHLLRAHGVVQHVLDEDLAEWVDAPAEGFTALSVRYTSFVVQLWGATLMAQAFVSYMVGMYYPPYYRLSILYNILPIVAYLRAFDTVAEKPVPSSVLTVYAGIHVVQIALCFVATKHFPKDWKAGRSLAPPSKDDEDSTEATPVAAAAAGKSKAKNA
jgi:hypothetical protein